jgi:hypothetical protein
MTFTIARAITDAPATDGRAPEHSQNKERNYRTLRQETSAIEKLYRKRNGIHVRDTSL